MKLTKHFLKISVSVVLVIFWFVADVHAQQGELENPVPLLKNVDREKIRRGLERRESIEDAGTNTGPRQEAPGQTSRTVAGKKDPGAVLSLQLKRNKIYNPSRNETDTVWLRGYMDKGREKNEGRELDLVAAPLIEVSPGETVRIDFYNHMLSWDDLPDELKTYL